MSTGERGSSTSLWRVSGVAARRFSELPYARYVLPVPARRLMVRVALLSALGWGGWRANEPGTAVCGLKGAVGRRQRLPAVIAWGIMGLAAIAVWIGWAAVWSSIGLIWVPAVSFLCAFALLVLLGIRGARVSKAKASLPRVDADRGRVVEIHVVASVEPGEGRRLLDGIVAEADRKGQRLVLDAANDRLVDYYGTFGFRAIGAAATMPYGERVTRMVRHPVQSDSGALADKHRLQSLRDLSGRVGGLSVSARLEGSQVARPPRRQWAIVVTCGAALSFLAGTAGQAAAAQPKWVPANIPAAFYDVVCPSPGFCAGVKDVGALYKAAADAVVGMYSGGVWHDENLPLKGLDPSPAKNPAVTITGLSCPARRRCVVVGSYVYGAQNREGLIATLAGDKWTSITAPLTGLTGVDAPSPTSDFFRAYLGNILCTAAGGCALAGVSCPTVSFCVSIGAYNAIGPNALGLLIETYRGWQVDC